jgi:hypothetical protein
MRTSADPTSEAEARISSAGVAIAAIIATDADVTFASPMLPVAASNHRIERDFTCYIEAKQSNIQRRTALIRVPFESALCCGSRRVLIALQSRDDDAQWPL